VFAVPGSDAMRHGKVIVYIWLHLWSLIFNRVYAKLKLIGNRQRVAHSHVHIVKRHFHVH